MVVGVLKGGIGNQLFIFAAAYDFASRNNLPLFFDINTGFRKDPYKRNCEIVNFIHPINLLSAQKSYTIKLLIKSNILHKRFNLLTAFRKIKIILNDSPLDSTDVKNNTIYYFQDYYQSEKYFKSSIGHLRRIFHTFSLPDQYYHLIKILNESTSLIIHGRLKRAYDAHGLIVETTSDAKQVGHSYFLNAVNWFLKNNPIKKIVLFSDAPEEFALLFLGLDVDVIVVNAVSRGNGIEELVLLTYGKKYIISNSTFGWWGAYMSRFENATVLVPSKHLWDTEIPNNWIVLD